MKRGTDRSYIEYENEVHYEPKLVESPDYLKWTVDEQYTFTYGYFSPESRVRLKLICSDEPPSPINVSSAVLETKVMLDEIGLRRAKTVNTIPTAIGLQLLEAAQRTLTKTIKSYAREIGSWELGFNPVTQKLISVEYALDDPEFYEWIVPPNFTGRAFTLKGDDRFYTFDQAAPRE